MKYLIANRRVLAVFLIVLTMLVLLPLVSVRPVAADPEGYYLTFHGNDYVEVPDSPSLDISGSITVEAWINPHTVPAAPDYRAVVYKQRNIGPKGGYGLLVTNDQSEVYFFTYGKGAAFAGAALTLDTCNHVVGTL